MSDKPYVVKLVYRFETAGEADDFIKLGQERLIGCTEIQMLVENKENG